jgi:magnesium transporter
LSRDSLGRLWQPFIDQARSRTDRPVELLVDMIDAISRQYQRRVAAINRQMRAATDNIHTLRVKDIATLAEYERKLNDYLDALIPMNWAVEKLLATSGLRLRADDKEDVEDLSIDLEQVIARCKSLLRTITNVRDSYRAVMDTRLNETIRLLTVITVALTIPTMIAGLFGMNVPVPGANDPLMFWKITVVSIVAACALGGFFLRKR